MTIRPGRNAVRLAAALAATATLLLVSDRILWLLLPAALCGVVLAWRDYRALCRRIPCVTVTRRHLPVVGRGVPFDLTHTIAADPPGPLAGELRDELPNVAQPRLLLFPWRLPPAVSSSSSVTLTHALTLPLRGRYTLGPLWLRLSGPHGFLDAQQCRDDRSTIRVLPETFASPDRFRKDLGAEIRLLDRPVFTRQHGDGTEFESLQEFRDGDDPRRMDWRATARLRRPIVRRFQIERHRDVFIAVDCGRLMGSRVEALHTAGESELRSTQDRGDKLDSAVDAALLLGRIALQGGDRCGFALFDHTLRAYLPPVSGAASMPALVDCAYDAAVDWGETDFAPLFAALQRRQAKRSLLIILSDLLDAATSEQYRGSVRRLAQRHVVLFAALRTPLLDDILNAPLESFEDAARQAVVYRLQHDRDAALQTLRHAGVHVLDVEPQRLAAPLINEFLALRRRNLL